MSGKGWRDCREVWKGVGACCDVGKGVGKAGRRSEKGWRVKGWRACGEVGGRNGVTVGRWEKW